MLQLSSLAPSIVLLHPSIHRSLCLLLWLLSVVNTRPAAAQSLYITQDAPCPRGERVDTDTLAFATTKSMPFDRCFYLKYILPGKQNVHAFVIFPVDEAGEWHVTRRDYHLYLKQYPELSKRDIEKADFSFKDYSKAYLLNSCPRQAYRAYLKTYNVKKVDFSFKDFRAAYPKAGYPRKAYQAYLKNFCDTTFRNIERSITPFSTFKKVPTYTASNPSRVTTVIKGNHTEVTLDVPPLEPGREYKIWLLAADNTNAQKLLRIGQMVFNSQRVTPLDTDLRDEAALLHRQSIASRRNDSKNKLATLEGFDEFVSTLYSFHLTFDGYSQHLPSWVDAGTLPSVREYRLFFTPLNSLYPAPSVSDLAALSPEYYISLKKDGAFDNPPFVTDNPVDVAITPTLDALGQPVLNKFDTNQRHLTWRTPIDLTGSTSYRIHAVAYDALSNTHLLEVGTLESSENGMLFKAIPKAKTNDGKWVETTRSIMGNYLVSEQQQTLITAHLDTLKKQPGGFMLTTLALCAEKARTCPCKEEGVKDLTARDNLLNTMAMLENPLLRYNAAQGLVTPDDLSAVLDPNAPNYNALRRANLKTTVSRLNEALEFIRKVRLVSPGQDRLLAGLLTDITTYNTRLESIAEQFDLLLKAEADSKEILASSAMLKNKIALSATGTNSILELVSENKFRIIPDFGFVIFFDRRESFSKSILPRDFSPYLGFNIGFRPIDKNIPWRMVRYKSLRHRLSFMSGVLLKSLAVPNERADFFGSTSLITGLGCRLNNFLRVTAGGVWVRAINANPLSEDRPIRVSPFVGISLDLELQELFGGINKWFKP